MSKVKILGQEYDSWEAPGCYAIGLLLILVGGLLVYTCPAPTSGILVDGTKPWQSEAWLNQSQSGLIMPTDIVTPTADPTLTASIKPTMMPTDKPVIVTPGNISISPFNVDVQSGVNVNMFTGVALGLFGICSILIGEIAAGREQTRRLKKQIKELTTTTAAATSEPSAPVVEGKQDAEK